MVATETRPRYRLLVIEDDHDIAELLRVHVPDIDASVDVAVDGALGLARAQAEQWDAIVLDIRLPGMNGLDVCRELRRTGNQIPILVMVWTMRRLTRPLRQLAQDLDAFRRDELADAEPPAGSDEIAVLRHAAGAMRARIEDQFRRLEQTDRMRRGLICNISHDLHTPLARIQGFVETLLIREEQLDSETRRRHLETALRHRHSLNRRTADLFELSKLEAARVELRCEPFVSRSSFKTSCKGHNSMPSNAASVSRWRRRASWPPRSCAPTSRSSSACCRT